jgi:alanine racemase
MDQIVVDVTDIPEATPGSKVTLLGTDGKETITADQMAAWSQTISYEILCGISRRVPRIYIQGGKTVHSVHYLLDPFSK